MAKVHCAISGLELKVSHFPMTLRNREMAHPIFYLPQKTLLSYYERYLKEGFNDIDTYLLYLALLHSTDHVTFAAPVKYRGGHTQKVIANTIDRLVKVMWQTSYITHPSFKQPRYVINADTGTNSLLGISDYLQEWENNIALFKLGRAHSRHLAKLANIEEKLSKVILSGTKGPQLAVQVANWAAKAAEFPDAVEEEWKRTIRKCYNSAEMFKTSKKTLLAIKEHCEGNIEAGTIHFHSLMEVLKEGITRHNDFLGLGSTTLVSLKDARNNYAIMDPEVVEKHNEAVLNVIANAPTTPPNRDDYPTNLAYLRAKLNYKVYLQHQKEQPTAEDVATEEAKNEISIDI